MEEIFLKLINRVKVKKRPIAIPFNYRPLYKVTEILLILLKCCESRKGCSIEKLHIISNVIKNSDELNELEEFILGNNNVLLIIRYDPVINRAIKYAVAENLIKIQKNQLMKLTNEGKKVAEEVNSDNDVFVREKEILDKISVNLTEEKIKSLLLDWRIKNVENK